MTQRDIQAKLDAMAVVYYAIKAKTAIGKFKLVFDGEEYTDIGLCDGVLFLRDESCSVDLGEIYYEDGKIVEVDFDEEDIRSRLKLYKEINWNKAIFG